jgi:hypothetical protein
MSDIKIIIENPTTENIGIEPDYALDWLDWHEDKIQWRYDLAD